MIFSCMKIFKKNLDLRILYVDHLPKLKKEYKNLKQTGDSRYIFQSESDKTGF